jgi:hypothetical protein
MKGRRFEAGRWGLVMGWCAEVVNNRGELLGPSIGNAVVVSALSKESIFYEWPVKRRSDGAMNKCG